MKHLELPSIHALIKRERQKGKSVWIAQGLEFDVVAFAPNERELHLRFIQTILAYVLDSLEKGENAMEGLNRIGEAPLQFWMEYVKAPREEKELPLSTPKKRQLLPKVSARSKLVVKALC